MAKLQWGHTGVFMKETDKIRSRIEGIHFSDHFDAQTALGKKFLCVFKTHVQQISIWRYTHFLMEEAREVVSAQSCVGSNCFYRYWLAKVLLNEIFSILYRRRQWRRQ